MRLECPIFRVYESVFFKKKKKQFLRSPYKAHYIETEPRTN